MAEIDGRGSARVEGNAELQYLRPSDIGRAGRIIAAVWRLLEYEGDAPVFDQLRDFDKMDIPPQSAEGEAKALLLAHRICVEHDDWKADKADGIERPHPLEPELTEWLHRVRDAREFVPVVKGSLMRLHRVEDAHLPALPPALREEAPSQPWLPSLEPSLTPCPSWLLWLYDQCGGRDLPGGKGANWSFRLFVYAFLHLDVRDRDGFWRSRRYKQDYLLGLLHPNGWANSRRDRDKFPEALRTINERLATIPIGAGWLNLIGTSYSPKHEAVEFNLRLPPAAAHGASVDWPGLLKSGTISDVRFRAHLAAAAFLDRSARAGHGITAEIGKAFRDDTGKPKRRKGGSVIRSATVTEANPSARFVRLLTDRDLAAMIGLDPGDRKARMRAKGAFRALADEGAVDLREEGQRGFRIFAPQRPVVLGV